MARVLLLGGLSGALAPLAAQAARLGAAISHADDLPQAVAILRHTPALGLVIADSALDLPALLRLCAAEHITVPVLAAGADVTPAQAGRLAAAGVRDVLCLPVDDDTLAAHLGLGPKQNGLGVFRDPAMLATVRRAEQVAGAEASVLITGESGTGKEVIARLIHAKSRRAGGPFVGVNCAAIPEALLESELFGHEKGAFSGAVARRLGKFEAAQGGTLLLDEISEMNVRLQSKLLRAIQEREIDRVGGTAPVRVNVRILATSNRNLPEEARAGRFREDLYFRLNVVSLRLPPLRERPEDIAALATHFARHYASLNGLPDRPLTQAALARLRAGAWRGNVRELENTLHRAVLLAEGDMIGPDAIELGDAPPLQAALGAAAESFVGRPIADVERDHILHTLTHTAGNRTHAAVLLGISIRALRNKLKDYAEAGVAVPPPQAGVPA